jgi:hypothetical protein
LHLQPLNEIASHHDLSHKTAPSITPRGFLWIAYDVSDTISQTGIEGKVRFPLHWSPVKREKSSKNNVLQRLWRLWEAEAMKLR